MSKVFLSLASFIIGVGATLILNGPPSIRAQVTFDATNAKGMSNFIRVNPQSVPAFASLDSNGKAEGITLKHGKQTLDGLRCEQCTFDDAELSYSGGPFDLNKLGISGTTHISYSGAAANTVALLDLLKSVGLGVDGVKTEPNTPIRRSTTTKRAGTVVTFTAPYTKIGPAL